MNGSIFHSRFNSDNQLPAHLVQNISQEARAFVNNYLASSGVVKNVLKAPYESKMYAIGDYE
jgi:hypothetical protein